MEMVREEGGVAIVLQGGIVGVGVHGVYSYKVHRF